MSIYLENPTVTTETLEEIVRHIRATGSPMRIVLFGSQARGEAGPGSDLDVWRSPNKKMLKVKDPPNELLKINKLSGITDYMLKIKELSWI